MARFPNALQFRQQMVLTETCWIMFRISISIARSCRWVWNIPLANSTGICDSKSCSHLINFTYQFSLLHSFKIIWVAFPEISCRGIPQTTNSMEHRLSWEPNSHSTSQEILLTFMEPEDSKLCSQQPATATNPESQNSSDYNSGSRTIIYLPHAFYMSRPSPALIWSQWRGE